MPWPYKKLDVEYVRKLGHLGYYKSNCSSGIFYAIFKALSQKVGYPYTAFPYEPVGQNLMDWGGGGGLLWGAMCGGLIGSLTVINMVSKDYKLIGNELIGWYAETPFPSEISNGYASRHEFLHAEFPPKFKGKYNTDKVLPQSISGSPLRHISVSKWCDAAGIKAFTPERAERCAPLTRDLAAKAVELLNLAADGQFVPFFKTPPIVMTCGSCHGKGGSREDTLAPTLKLDCMGCHDNDHSTYSKLLGGTRAQIIKTVTSFPIIYYFTIYVYLTLYSFPRPPRHRK